MRKKAYVVRVELKAPSRDMSQLIEQLRYAGTVKVQRNPVVLDDQAVLQFDINPPHGLDTKLWAEQNAARMRSFHYKATAVEKE